jgi:hypothetical protein
MLLSGENFVRWQMRIRVLDVDNVEEWAEAIALCVHFFRLASFGHDIIHLVFDYDIFLHCEPASPAGPNGLPRSISQRSLV